MEVWVVVLTVTHVALWLRLWRLAEVAKGAKDLAFAALVHDHTDEAWPQEFTEGVVG